MNPTGPPPPSSPGPKVHPAIIRIKTQYASLPPATTAQGASPRAKEASTSSELTTPKERNVNVQAKPGPTQAVDIAKLQQFDKDIKKAVTQYKTSVASAMQQTDPKKREEQLKEGLASFNQSIPNAYTQLHPTEVDSLIKQTNNTPELGTSMNLAQKLADREEQLDALKQLLTDPQKLVFNLDSLKNNLREKGPSALPEHLKKLTKLEEIEEFLTLSSDNQSINNIIESLLDSINDLRAIQEKCKAIEGLEHFQEDNKEMIDTFKTLTSIFAITVILGFIFWAIRSAYESKYNTADEARKALIKDLKNPSSKRIFLQ